MFTGIIEHVGVIESVVSIRGGSRLRIGCRTGGMHLETGDSIAVDGVCLTVTARGGRWFEAEVGPETRRRSTLGQARQGREVNLERPLQAGGRLGGHFVQGHVDAIATVRSMRRRGEFQELELESPPALRRYMVEKGSVAINGVSLTIASMRRGVLSISLVPHTLEMTNLSRLRAGAKVNIEVDVLAKYVESLIAGRRMSRP